MIIKSIHIASLFSAVPGRVRFTVVWQAWWTEGAGQSAEGFLWYLKVVGSK